MMLNTNRRTWEIALFGPPLERSCSKSYLSLIIYAFISVISVILSLSGESFKVSRISSLLLISIFSSSS